MTWSYVTEEKPQLNANGEWALINVILGILEKLFNDCLVQAWHLFLPVLLQTVRDSRKVH